MSYTTSRHSRIARAAARPVALMLLGHALAACGDVPTTPPSADVPGHAMLAKGGKLDQTTAIVYSINGANGQNLYLTDTLGTRVEQLTFGGLDDYPSWSPDRRKIAFSRGDGVNTEIYVKSLSGGREMPVGIGVRPSWSPDGVRIAFTSKRTGARQVFTMKAATGGDVKLLSGGNYTEDYDPAWTH